MQFDHYATSYQHRGLPQREYKEDRTTGAEELEEDMEYDMRDHIVGGKMSRLQ